MRAAPNRGSPTAHPAKDAAAAAAGQPPGGLPAPVPAIIPATITREVRQQRRRSRPARSARWPGLRQAATAAAHTATLQPSAGAYFGQFEDEDNVGHAHPARPAQARWGGAGWPAASQPGVPRCCSARGRRAAPAPATNRALQPAAAAHPPLQRLTRCLPAPTRSRRASSCRPPARRWSRRGRRP